MEQLCFATDISYVRTESYGTTENYKEKIFVWSRKISRSATCVYVWYYVRILRTSKIWQEDKLSISFPAWREKKTHINQQHTFLFSFLFFNETNVFILSFLPSPFLSPPLPSKLAVICQSLISVKVKFDALFFLFLPQAFFRASSSEKPSRISPFFAH